MDKCTLIPYMLQFYSFSTRPSPNGWRDAHNRAQIGWTTPPSGLYTQPDPPVLSTNGVYELHILVPHTSMKVTIAVHTYSIRFKQYASLTKLDTRRYGTFMSICRLLFSLKMRHTTEPQCSVVCVYVAGCRVVCMSVRLCRGSPVLLDNFHTKM